MERKASLASPLSKFLDEPRRAPLRKFATTEVIVQPPTRSLEAGVLSGSTNSGKSLAVYRITDRSRFEKFAPPNGNETVVVFNGRVVERQASEKEKARAEAKEARNEQRKAILTKASAVGQGPVAKDYQRKGKATGCPAAAAPTHDRIFQKHEPKINVSRAQKLRSEETRGRAFNLIDGRDNSLTIPVLGTVPEGLSTAEASAAKLQRPIAETAAAAVRESEARAAEHAKSDTRLQRPAGVATRGLNKPAPGKLTVNNLW